MGDNKPQEENIMKRGLCLKHLMVPIVVGLVVLLGQFYIQSTRAYGVEKKEIIMEEDKPQKEKSQSAVASPKGRGLATRRELLLVAFIQILVVAGITYHFNKSIENYKYDFKVREQAAKISEYLSLYIKNDPNDFVRMNQFSFELALWLPEEVYKNLGPALQKQEHAKHVFEVIIDVRKHLLKGGAGNLTGDDIIVHGKDFGKGPNTPK